jgi:hypothetical protein
MMNPKSSRLGPPLEPTVESYIARHGQPSRRSSHQTGASKVEWNFLVWACGCAASYATDTSSNDERDLLFDICDRHR